MTAANRNMNPQVFWDRRGQAHRPRYVFSGKTANDFRGWQRELLPKVLATLGTLPKAVDPRPELVVEWREEGLIKQRWLIDVQENLSAAVWLFRPDNLKPGEKRPAILCCHGHGPYGKNSVMGIAPTPEQVAEVKNHNYDYGRQMAKAASSPTALTGWASANALKPPNPISTTACGSAIPATSCTSAPRCWGPPYWPVTSTTPKSSPTSSVRNPSSTPGSWESWGCHWAAR